MKSGISRKSNTRYNHQRARTKQSKQHGKSSPSSKPFKHHDKMISSPLSLSKRNIYSNQSGNMAAGQNRSFFNFSSKEKPISNSYNKYGDLVQDDKVMNENLSSVKMEDMFKSSNQSCKMFTTFQDTKSIPKSGSIFSQLLSFTSSEQPSEFNSAWKPAGAAISKSSNKSNSTSFTWTIRSRKMSTMVAPSRYSLSHSLLSQTATSIQIQAHILQSKRSLSSHSSDNHDKFNSHNPKQQQQQPGPKDGFFLLDPIVFQEGGYMYDYTKYKSKEEQDKVLHIKADIDGVPVKTMKFHDTGKDGTSIPSDHDDDEYFTYDTTDKNESSDYETTEYETDDDFSKEGELWDTHLSHYNDDDDDDDDDTNSTKDNDNQGDDANKKKSQHINVIDDNILPPRGNDKNIQDKINNVDKKGKSDI